MSTLVVSHHVAHNVAVRVGRLRRDAVAAAHIPNRGRVVLQAARGG
jgi:hypothetical protein